jgi:hypothetical protein
MLNIMKKNSFSKEKEQNPLELSFSFLLTLSLSLAKDIELTYNIKLFISL